MNSSFSSKKQSFFPSSHIEAFSEISNFHNQNKNGTTLSGHFGPQIYQNLFQQGGEVSSQDFQPEQNWFYSSSNLDSRNFLDSREETKGSKSPVFSSSGESLSPSSTNQGAHISQEPQNQHISFARDVDLKFGCNMSEEEIHEPSMDSHHHSLNGNEHSTISKSGIKTKIRRKAWQDQEDEQLLELVERYGKKWSKIASIMKGRTGKQIRDRYLNNLNPEIVDKEWTPEEDNMILFLYYNWGKKWSKIASALPGRSEGQVKNRFYWGLKRKVLNCQFTNYDPIELLSQHNNTEINLDKDQSKSSIPRISLKPMTPMIDQTVYWDYPSSLLKNNNDKDTTTPTSVKLTSNPDDFISYNTAPDDRVDLSRFLNNYPPN